jgi:hypothetical protein
MWVILKLSAKNQRGVMFFIDPGRIHMTHTGAFLCRKDGGKRGSKGFYYRLR